MSSEKRERDNSIYIGQKDTMSYVLACITAVQAGAKDLILKARGRAISRAVDVAEICRNRFMKDQVQIEKIEIGTEQIQSKDRGTFSVSTMEITLKFK
ncbi:MAG: DNA-binding protein Alba [Candidatus Helarchaeota archaeon]|nr:DNA-binding protein Alba [Candidatus Helarchaeota archaeon]